MSQSIILSLRQQESNSVQRNGVWETTLDHPVLLEAGDTVQVKSVFLDTVADTIELDEDTEITMTALLYLCNGRTDQVWPYNNAANWPNYATPVLRQYFDAPNNNTASGPVFPVLDGGGAGTNGTHPMNGDNELWFMSSTHTVAAGSTNWSISNVEITPINKTSQTRDFGGLTIHFRHKTLAPGSPYIVTPCKITAARDFKWTSVNPFALGIQCTGTAIGPDCTLVEDIEYLNTWGIESVNFTQYQQQLTPGEKYVSPEYATIKFTIPAGTYTPPEIAKEINNAVGNLQNTGGASVDYQGAESATIPDAIQWPSMNPFLTTILKKTQELQDRDSSNLYDLELAFVNADERYGSGPYLDINGRNNGGELYFRYDIAQMQAENNTGGAGLGYPLDKFVGTNQFSMDFDEVENKLKITQCHFPLYVEETSGQENGVPGVAWNKGGANGMKLNPDPNPGTNTAQFVGSTGIQAMYSGIVFTGLEPAEFWNNLGFSDITVTPNFNKKMRIGGGTVGNPPVDAYGGDGGNATLPTDNNSYTLKVDIGRNTTAGYDGLDLPVQHINTFTRDAKDFKGQYSVPRFVKQRTGNLGSDAPYDDVYVATNDVRSIFSSRTLNTNIADEGYFLVDVESSFRQDLVGGKGITSKATQSIVNRYYSDGGFTSDQGAGSIAYVHEGEPQLLSSMNVQVRNPDRTFVQETVLLPKNSVFMEIIKARPTPDA